MPRRSQHAQAASPSLPAPTCGVNAAGDVWHFYTHLEDDTSIDIWFRGQPLAEVTFTAPGKVK